MFSIFLCVVHLYTFMYMLMKTSNYVDEIMFSPVPSVIWVRIICVCWCLHRTNTMQCFLMSSSEWWYKCSSACDKIREAGGQNRIKSDTCIYVLHFLSHFRGTHQCLVALTLGSHFLRSISRNSIPVVNQWFLSILTGYYH